MIVCTECGHQNDDGDGFCGSCGTYLEWSGERVDAPTPVAEPLGAPRDRTIVEKAKEIVGLDPDARAKAAAAEEERAASEAETRAATERQARSDAEVAAHQADEAEQAARNEAAKALSEQAAAEQAARVRAVEEERARQRADLTRKEAEAAAAARQAAEREAAAAATAELQEAEERARRAAEEATNREVAAAQAQAALEAEEQARRAAEERARNEAEAAARAEAEAEEAQRRKAEEEERARRAAEGEVRARAEAQERSARAQALIARTPEPTKAKAAASPTGQPQADDEASAGREPGLGTPGAPAAVKPGAAARKRAPVAPAAPKRAIRPGDLICGQCGEPNDAGRRFCRRCGHSLQEAVVAKVPWWRRPFVARRKPPPVAGTRRVANTGTAVAGPGAAKRASVGARRGFGFIMKGLIGFGALVLLLGTVIPVKNPIGEWRKDVVGWVQDRIDPQYEPVRPDSATASSAGRPAENAIDGLRNTSWAADGGDGVGQVLALHLARPTDLDRVGITNGASEGPEDFAANPRPERIRLLFSDGSAKEITLKDTADFQTFTVDATATTEVRLQVVSAYPGTGGGQLAIAEVELFGQKDRR